MADEERNPETSQVTPEPAAVEGAAEGRGQAAPREMDLDAVVKVDGRRVTLREMLAERQELGSLRELREHVSTLMRGEGAGWEDREKAIRHVMAVEGYHPDEIDAYVSASREAVEQMMHEEQAAGSVEETEGKPAPRKGPAQGNEELEAMRQELAQMKEQMQAEGQRRSQGEVERLRRDLNEIVGSTLDGHEKVQVLLGAAQRLNGDEGQKATSQHLRAELERQMLEQMRYRQGRGERFQKSWFQEEAGKAADAVFERYRSVIGDPDRVQRAPETVAGQEAFLAEKPVPKPTYDRMDSPSVVREKAHAWTQDTLSRLAREIGRGGQSAV